MRPRRHIIYRTALAALFCQLALSVWAGDTQPVVGGKGFKFSGYHERPNDTKIKWLLDCAEAQQQPDKRIVLTQARYRTFRVTGEGEMAVEAPQCVYDLDRKTLSSAGPIHAQTADGAFTIDGEGFLWRQTNSTLLVSNRVHTTLHPELAAKERPAPSSATPTPRGPDVDIFSDQFEYGQTTGKAVYENNVRVAGTNLNATAGHLTVLMPVAERRLQSVTAEERVVVNYEQIHATGEWAFYDEDTGLVQMKGQPTWRYEQESGSGDELVFDRTNRIFRALGHGRLRVPAARMDSAAFLAKAGSATNHTVPPTNHFVEVACDNYVLQTNIAVFHKDVRVDDWRDDQPQGHMTCGIMTLTFIGTNQLDKLVAEQEVVIAQGDRQFTAARADYYGTNSLLDLSGNPVWHAGTREGSGDWMRMNLTNQEMLVRGNAVMKMPAGEVGRTKLMGTPGPKTTKPKPELAGTAQILSQEYLVTPTSALFQGGVRIEHPQMTWTSKELTMLSPPELGKDGHMVIAEPDVVFDLLDDQGRVFHGIGQKAVYTRRVSATFTNDIMELTGNPATLSTTNFNGRNNRMVYDLGHQTLFVPGKFHAQGTMPGSATNLFRPLGRGRSR